MFGNTLRRSMLVLVASLALPSLGLATILPLNDLHRHDRVRRTKHIDEQKFLEIGERIGAHFAPIVSKHGGVLKMEMDWEDHTVNAYAKREEGSNEWIVHMFGGLARREEVTPDAFTMVVCHELGHHLAGYPFKEGRWAASEGQSDYYASQVCARELWKNEHEENERARREVSKEVAFACNMNWRKREDRDLCYRVSNAGIALATLLSRINNRPVDPAMTSRDKSAVDFTFENHPDAQCRLDTYLSGALCNRPFDIEIIPGLPRGREEGRNTASAERHAMRFSCRQEKDLDPRRSIRYGARPLCWFKPLDER